MTHEFQIPDIHCGGCARTITRVLGELDPSAEVDIDVAAKQVRVSSALSREALATRLADAGFPPA